MHPKTQQTHAAKYNPAIKISSSNTLNLSKIQTFLTQIDLSCL